MTDKIVPFENIIPIIRGQKQNHLIGHQVLKDILKSGLIKKIISDVSLSNVLLVSLYVSQIPTEHGPSPVFNAYIGNLNIQVPQGCTINEGTSFTVNMPDVWASEVSRAGAGAKPAGVTL